MIRIICLIIFHGFLLAESASPGKTTVYNFTCASIPELCADLKCDFEKVDVSNIKISLGCNITKVLHSIKLKVTSHQKGKNGGWKKDRPDILFDLCQVTAGGSHPLIRTFLPPGFSEKLGSLIHPCPYSGVFFVEKIDIALANIPMFKPLGTILRTDISFQNFQSRNLLTLSFYNEVVPM